jgi:hypothetical protein
MTRIANYLVVVKPNGCTAFIDRNDVIDFRFEFGINIFFQASNEVETEFIFVIDVAAVKFVDDFFFYEWLPVVLANITRPVLTQHEKEYPFFSLGPRPRVRGGATVIVCAVSGSVMF